MKKVIIAMLIILLIFVGGVYYLYQSLWGPGVNNSSDYELYIPTGASYDHVNHHLQSENLLKSPYLFDLLADQMNYKKAVSYTHLTLPTKA